MINDNDNDNDNLEAAIYAYTEDHNNIRDSHRAELIKAIDKLSERYDELYRGINGDYSSYQVGDLISSNNTILSLTDDIEIAEKFARGKSLDKNDRNKSGVVLVFNDIDAMSIQGRFSDESEHIAKADQTYEIRDITFDEKINIYYFKVV